MTRPPARRHRGAALILLSLTVLAIALAGTRGLGRRVAYDAQALRSSLRGLQAEALARGGLDLLVAHHHRYGAAAAAPLVPFPAPATTGPLANRELGYRISWELQRIPRGPGRTTLHAGVSIHMDDTGQRLLARRDVKRTDMAILPAGPAAVQETGHLGPARPRFALVTRPSGGLSRIHVMRTDLVRPTGPGVAVPIETGADDRDPALHPLAHRVVFVRPVAGIRQVCDMSLDGSDVRVLTQESSDCSSPAFRPDGRLLFYAQPAAGRIRYILHPPPPSNPPATLLSTASPTAANTGAPNSDGGATATVHDELAISPDGQFLAFSALRTGGVACLYVYAMGPAYPVLPIPTPANPVHRYTSRQYHPAGVEAPSFSPDGSWIALLNRRVTGPRWQQGEIVKLPLRNGATFPSGALQDTASSTNGGTILRLTDDVVPDASPRFDLDGTRIHYMASNGTFELWQVDANVTNGSKGPLTAGLALDPRRWTWSPDD